MAARILDSAPVLDSRRARNARPGVVLHRLRGERYKLVAIALKGLDVERMYRRRSSARVKFGLDPFQAELRQSHPFFPSEIQVWRFVFLHGIYPVEFNAYVPCLGVPVNI